MKQIVNPGEGVIRGEDTLKDSGCHRSKPKVYRVCAGHDLISRFQEPLPFSLQFSVVLYTAHKLKYEHANHSQSNANHNPSANKTSIRALRLDQHAEKAYQYIQNMRSGN